MDSTDDTKKGFFKYVFSYDSERIAEIQNLIQYALLTFIPVIILNKGISKFIPEVDDSKSSLEISAEILIQVITIFIGLFHINRMVGYIPTYSGVKYPDINVIYTVSVTLMFLLSLQTKVGEKANVLIDRLLDMWNGTDSKKAKKPTKGVYVNKQPITTRQPNNVATGQSYSDGTAINSLPSNEMTQNNTPNSLAPQQLPNYNNMFEKDTNPLVGASSPGSGGQEGFMEPMAANSVLGGGFGSSW